ncbi:MAG TPA: RES family NAD+ phosphorylase [Caulobacter sp.]|nr:RES family NAD+ phosphorylase [Caulobacter sp.]
MMAKAWDEISGTFYRVLFEADRQVVLDGAKSPEGRFHHDGQPALYLSPTADWAAAAIDVYRRAGDPPRSTVPLRVDHAKIVDLRKSSHCAALSIDAEDAAIPWRTQRSRGDRADSWKPAKAVRASDADGMIYTARSAPDRWHLVLFRWNGLGGPMVAVADEPGSID